MFLLIQITYKILQNGSNFENSLISIFQGEQNRILGLPGVLDSKSVELEFYLDKLNETDQVDLAFQLLGFIDSCSNSKDNCHELNGLPLSKIIDA